MNLIELFSNSKIEDIALVLNGILNRIPVLICGDDDQHIEEFMNELTTLFPFRNTMIFYTDFSSIDDYNALIENEEQDFDIQRNVYLCYPFALEKLMDNIDKFPAWIIGCSSQELGTKSSKSIQERLFENSPFYLFIELKPDFLMVQIEGKKFPNLDVNFEKWLYQDAIKKTEISVEKMRRVISKRINVKKIGQDQYKNIMNFNSETLDLKYNFLKKEISNFYQACRRSFSILSRINTVKENGIKMNISTKTLINTVAYDRASVKTILEFIKSEWKINYEKIMELKTISNFTDTFESLWG